MKHTAINQESLISIHYRYYHCHVLLHDDDTRQNGSDDHKNRGENYVPFLSSWITIEDQTWYQLIKNEICQIIVVFSSISITWR